MGKLTQVERQKRYEKTAKGKAALKRYTQSAKGRAKKKRYNQLAKAYKTWHKRSQRRTLKIEAMKW